tara:strand:- start:59 stop:952 length:894 start_codon:yes stop_codon:yes gene_type:complete
MPFVTEDLRSAITEARQFEENEKYNDSVCMKECCGGVKENTFNKSLENIAKYASEDDVAFYKFVYSLFSKPKCCLPKGHKGKCKSSYTSYFAKAFANKIKDCDTTPGNDDILFKNRSRRTYPVQVTKENYTKLNAKYKWKGNNVKLKAGTPVEHGGTPYTIATAHFDFAAILMLQKDIEHNLPEDVEEKLKARAKEIVKEFEDQGIYITDDNGQLCCPVLQLTLEADWYKDADKSDPNQIQFGHVNPLKSNKYMTRGGNVIPITRNGNLQQSDKTIQQTYADQEAAVERRKARRLSR